MSEGITNSPRRVPSTGYSLSLIVAAFGVTCVTVALAGTLFQRSGGDPVQASGLPGQAAFACSFGLLFASRPIFSATGSATVRHLMRAMVSVALVAELLGVIVAVALVVTGRGPIGMFLGIFVVLALGCQIGTLLWLLRYRTE